MLGNRGSGNERTVATERMRGLTSSQGLALSLLTMLLHAQLKGALLIGHLENDFIRKYHGHLSFVTEPSEG